MNQLLCKMLLLTSVTLLDACAGVPSLRVLYWSIDPDFDGATDSELKFLTTYRKHVFDGNTWSASSKTDKGYWEYDGDESFPPREQFP